MRRLTAALFLVFLFSPLLFAGDVWRSSSTITNDGAYQRLCRGRSVFHGICTDFGVAAASTTIVNSSFTVVGVNQIGPVTTFVVDQCKYYDAQMPNGLGYQKTNVAGVTILYSCYQN